MPKEEGSDPPCFVDVRAPPWWNTLPQMFSPIQYGWLPVACKRGGKRLERVFHTTARFFPESRWSELRAEMCFPGVKGGVGIPPPLRKRGSLALKKAPGQGVCHHFWEAPQIVGGEKFFPPPCDKKKAGGRCSPIRYVSRKGLSQRRGVLWRETVFEEAPCCVGLTNRVFLWPPHFQGRFKKWGGKTCDFPPPFI